MTDCLFCRIAAGEIPSKKVYEDEQVLAFYDIAPQAPVHVLIIPKRHIAGANALTREDDALLGHLFEVARQLAKELGVADTGYRLITNIGGEFEPGDRILFDMSHHDQNVDLFEIPVPAQLEQELVIELDGESGPDDRYCWQTATISPISFQLDGIYGSGETSNEAVSITLKDGTSFTLSSAENGHEDSLYGTYGSWGSSYAGSWESGDVKETWLFSQLIDLADLASITVDGVTYPVG